MNINLSTRQAFGEALAEVMEKDEKVVAITADLGESLRMLELKEKFPQRFLDTGVAEANMAGIAAGLALAGFKPTAGTFAVFLARAFDHIRVQICQNNVHVVIVGSHGGVSNAADGASAQALEDIAYMRALPNMKIVFPSDYNEMKNALPMLFSADGPIYLRLYREPTPIFTDIKKRFEVGKAQVVRKGKNISIIGTGPQTAYAVQAADILQKKNIDAEIISVPTIQPLDSKTILASGKKTGRVVTVEDHSINGGLGSAVAELFSENYPLQMKRLGARKYGESGSFSEMIKNMGIDTESIVDAARKMLKK